MAATHAGAILLGMVGDAVLRQPALLRDGTLVGFRPVEAGDEPALHALLRGLGANSRRMRFFTSGADLDRAAHWAAQVEPDTFGIIARDAVGRLVGHAAYARVAPGRAEVAVEVADDMHGLGLGTILVERLAAAAERQGIARFVADVLPENRAMLDVFRDGFDARVVLREGTDAVEFPTSAWRTARLRFGRERSQPKNSSAVS